MPRLRTTTIAHCSLAFASIALLTVGNTVPAQAFPGVGRVLKAATNNQPAQSQPAQSRPTQQSPQANAGSGRPRPEDRAPAVCKTSWRETHPDFRISMLVDSSGSAALHREEMVKTATKAQFVSITEDFGKRGSVGKETYSARKGEPLLLISCSGDKSFEAMTLDGRDVGSIPQTILDATPQAFVFPEQHASEDFDAHAVFTKAIESDYAAVPGSRQLAEQRSRCSDQGIGSCQAAEKRVAPGPNYDERRRDACSDATRVGFDRCFSGKLKSDYMAKAKQLDKVERARNAAFIQEIKDRLSAR